MASNPFLMDTTAKVEAPNPFLMDPEPVLVSNPFLVDEMPATSTVAKPANPFADDLIVNSNNAFATVEQVSQQPVQVESDQQPQPAQQPQQVQQPQPAQQPQQVQQPQPAQQPQQHVEEGCHDDDELPAPPPLVHHPEVPEVKKEEEELPPPPPCVTKDEEKVDNLTKRISDVKVVEGQEDNLEVEKDVDQEKSYKEQEVAAEIQREEELMKEESNMEEQSETRRESKTEMEDTKREEDKKSDAEENETSDVIASKTSQPTSSPTSETQTTKEEAKVESMSTGEALFSELPAANLSSTGVHIFGLNEETSAESTGANLFDVKPPSECARPALGQMSGWDEDFDAKFDTAATADAATIGGFGDSIVTVPGKDPFDPFCGSTSGAALFSTPSPFNTTSLSESDKSFGQDDFDPQALKKNPFLDKETKQALKVVDEDEELFDSDTSQPLVPLPRSSLHEMQKAEKEGWKCFVRYPAKKKLGQSRYWKKVLLKLNTNDKDKSVAVQLFEVDKAEKNDKPIQEIQVQPAYSISEISHQVFDQYTKLFTLKLQFVSYKERAGIRPGQLSKMQRLTGKFGFLAKAVEDADYEGVKEFASDMKKLGVPLEHAPIVTELLKIGSESYEELRQLTLCFEEKLFNMDALRDRALTYKAEEVQLTAVEEVFVEQTKMGHVVKQLCRVRVFFLSFLTGMPTIELGVNDTERMGLEVVGRHDILPVPTEQWIRYEDVQLHPVVDKKAFEESHIIRFVPPDACYLELLRFRTRPPRTKELPLQARCSFEMNGNWVEIRSDLLIPFIPTKAWGQVYCDDVAVRIPLPECWIYQFRTEKHHVSLSQLAAGNINLGTRMGSVKSAHRRAGKVKGIERLIGAIDSSQSNSELMETSSGNAKYEHQHRAIVWRIPRLPKHGQGSYTSHEFVCRLQLTSFDELPSEFERNFYVEFTQPATPTSNTVLRSVSISDSESEEPAEKFVKYLARHEYKLEIEFKEKEQSSYVAASKESRVESREEEKNNDDDEEFPDAKFEKKDSDSDSD